MGLPILCYHKVGHESTEGRWLTISPERLATHVRHFARRGFQFVLPRDLHGTWPARAVCFTFDDAYESALHEAPPILLDSSARCAFYAVPSKVGQSSDWDRDRARPLADWAELKRADSRGFEIGNHSMAHRRLTELPLEGQSLDLRTARDEFMRHGLRAETVAYPYGAINGDSLTAAAQAGYKIGLSLGKRVARRRQDRLLALPRIVLSYGDGIPMLLYKLHVRPRLP